MPHRHLFCLSALLLAATLTASAQQEPKYLDPNLPAAERANDLVSRMTLQEKADQLEDWATAIPRLGIPDYQTWNEALHGVARAGYATVFPQAIGMAATWDTSLVHTEGSVISEEARGKYNQAQREGNHRIFFGLTFWSPNINIFRDPRWGRGQETYGEDPYLTSRMGVAFVEGVQGPDPNHPRAVATSKHFAVHNGPESIRHKFDINPSPRDLEETYLPAFRATVTEAHVGSVMCAYTGVDGYADCTNKMLLQEHLRNDWGFKGFVVSDCGAIVDVYRGHHQQPDIEHAAVQAIQAGVDLSCSMWTPGFNTLAQAVKDGLVSEALVTRSAERLYTARFKLGLFDPPNSSPNDKIQFSVVADSANRAQALKAAEESIVLLKNDGTLPLRKPEKIAVIGPEADLLNSLLGNYRGTPLHPVTPLDGMLRQFKSASILYAQGSTLADGVVMPVPRTVFDGGLKTQYFATPDWTGRPVAVATSPDIQADWENALPVPEIQSKNYSVRWTGTITVPASGHYVFSVENRDAFPYSPAESYRFILDGKVLSEGLLRKGQDLSSPELAAKAGYQYGKGNSPTAPPYDTESQTPTIAIDFADTKPHRFEFDYSHSIDRAGGGVTLKWQPPAGVQLERALAAARQADIVVAFVGLSPDLEGEEMDVDIDGFDGGDRTKLVLPAAQKKLLQALASTGKPLVVVLENGSAVALNWAKDHANAIVETWYPGVAGGTAIARTLAGLNNPAGRLPVTFYTGVNDLPPFTDYSMKNRTYRYYTGKPLWGFGYGLSYSHFKYSPVKLSARTLKAGEPLTATVMVTNTGSYSGDEVVEAYLKTPQPDGPIHSLVAFDRVSIPTGTSREVTLKIDPRSLSSVDDRGNRSILPGEYRLSIGGAQPQETTAKSETTFTITGTKPLPR